MLAREVTGLALAGRIRCTAVSFRDMMVSPVGIPLREARDFDCSVLRAAISSAVCATRLFIIPLLGSRMVWPPPQLHRGTAIVGWQFSRAEKPILEMGILNLDLNNVWACSINEYLSGELWTN